MSAGEIPIGSGPRLGLIGFGAASRMVLHSLTNHGGFNLVGVADTDAVVRDAFVEQWGAPAFDSIDALLENVALDAVYIATPTKFHEQHAIKALNAGLHVLVEKPMALTIDSALAMIAAAKANDRLLLENHKRSVDRPIITMWKMMEAGLTGSLRAVHRLHFSSWFYRPRAEEERDPETGGIVLRQGAHEFDIIRLLTQSPATRVWGWTADYDRDRPGEGSYQASVEFANGVRATSVYSGYDHFDSSEFTSGPRDATAIGKTWRSSLELDKSVDEAELKRHTIERPVAGAVRADNNLFGFTLLNAEQADARPSPDANVFLYGKDGRVEYAMGGLSGTDLIASEFSRAITDKAPVLHDGSYGLAVLELCLAVRRSARQGGDPVELAHQYEIPSATLAAVIGDRDLGPR